MSLVRPLAPALALTLSVLLAACNRQGHVRAGALGDMDNVGVEAGRFDARQAEACGPGGPLTTARFDRWPYVQKVDRDGFELLWTTADPVRFEVRVTDPEGRTLASTAAVVDPTASPPGDARQYVARFDELPAGETLCYQVFGAEEAWTGRTGVTTAPRDASQAVQFVALGDVGKRTSDQYAVLKQLQRVQFDFMLVTGDVAYDDGTRRQLERYFFDVYRNILSTRAVFPATGNHDYRTADARAFREAFSLFDNGTRHGKERWYSFDWGPVHVAVIDTQVLEPTQVQWLHDDLSATNRPWKVVVGHRPPYASGHHGSSETVRELFVPTFERGDVSLALFGHNHQYERTVPIDGVVYVVTGGGGRGTRKTGASEITAFSERVAHFVWVEATPSTLRLVAVDATGQQFDSLLLARE